MESYDKNGKRKTCRRKLYSSQERKIWNCVAADGTKSDVLGSYSGTDEYDEEPVQDADDL